MIRRLFPLLIACFCTVILLFGLFIFLAFDMESHVERQTIVSPIHIERLKRVFDQHRQRVLTTRKDTPAMISLHPDDVDIATHYIVKHFVNGQANLRLTNQKAEIKLSIPVSFLIIAGYINVSATLIETDGLPQLQSVTVGSFTVPDAISHFLMNQGINWLHNNPKYHIAISAIKQIHISLDTLQIRYQWQSGSGTSDIRLPILSKHEQKKVQRYYHLLKSSNQQRATLSMSEILQPLMQMATRYSIRNSAQIENRAAILAATFYITNLPLKYVAPDMKHQSRHYHKTVTLDGRRDFAQHFIVSAAITAYADTALSDAIGVYKEIEDKRSGSGFSFNDIAADRAGTRFGERATSSHTQAVRLQQLVAQGMEDQDFMPTWQDLPESLSKRDFRLRYGNLNAPAYLRIMATIEQRVATLPFLD